MKGSAEWRQRGRGPIRRNLVRMHRDERGLVIGFFIRIILVMALLGFAVEEGGQLIVAQIHAEDAARSAAQAAADAYRSASSGGRSPHLALRAARVAAVEATSEQDPNAHVDSVEVSADGVASVTVSETARTVVVKRVSFLKKYGVQHATEEEAHST
jgi:Flp pilus assembly protein TadG